ncbi:MAG: gluconolactonase [Rhizobiales bacterium]|uniref:SMP-30/gluconolactonase/LRE family protein n=1 Tax=unclassified Leeuwenhoekiella TaxID=2615029 RepID=UPI000C42ABE1|nr:MULTISPECIES: SMP-30/gluconolactonase/LRE family protein [unclassified Leeuwenhoekiella]MAW94214.1 gluconolactonase [Leeuwenhoekiella sp.]MAW96872.1 gluconolactonase [Leeuwenhoekiella sp.]MBA67589.1 gluconolactonase [Hyphomicrobiales bacterium]|tara:strand:+ start:872 stop:1759 length:888 start_codon:yes stop_codon:yes gene_type:complete
MLKQILTLTSIALLTACGSQEPLVKAGSSLQLLSDRFSFTEGPAADAQGNVYFTDQPNDRIYKWDATTDSLTVFMEGAGRANGLYFDASGNLLAAADNQSELWKISPQKDVQVLVTSYEDKRLNGPNDIWIAPNGNLYFTDPFYKRPYWEHSEKEIEAEQVYLLTPEGDLRIAATDFVKPNGIIGTPDGKTLYIADIGANKTYVFDIADNGDLIKKRLFVEQGSDGMTLDSKGNVYLTGKGVTIYDQQGTKVQHIAIPKDWTANVTFGGKDRKTLFITAQQAVYLLEMNVQGAKP